MSLLTLAEAAAPATPSTGKVGIYVKSDGLMYWKDDAGTEYAVFGLSATQAQQEAGSSLVVAVTPGRQQYHPSAAKAWVKFNASTGTPTINVSFNVTSLTDNGVGDTTVNFTTAFSGVDYAHAAMCGAQNTQEFYATGPFSSAPTASAFRFGTFSAANVLVDLANVAIIFFGDQ